MHFNSIFVYVTEFYFYQMYIASSNSLKTTICRYNRIHLFIIRVLLIKELHKRTFVWYNINKNKRSKLKRGEDVELQFSDVQSPMFLTEEECENFLMKMRWSNGFCCPRCDYNVAFKIHSRRLLECKECRMQVSITAGTIMHKSKLSLLHWFRAIQLLLQEGKEYTASSLSHILEINYRSAQLMLQKIHYAYLIKENRLNLFRKVRESASEAPIFNDQESNEETPLTILNQNSSNEWNLRSYLESKLNRLNTKLKLQNILPKEYQRYLHKKNRSGFTFNKWIKTFISVYLYPTFLKCFQLSA